MSKDQTQETAKKDIKEWSKKAVFLCQIRSYLSKFVSSKKGSKSDFSLRINRHWPRVQSVKQTNYCDDSRVQRLAESRPRRRANYPGKENILGRDLHFCRSESRCSQTKESTRRKYNTWIAQSSTSVSKCREYRQKMSSKWAAGSGTVSDLKKETRQFGLKIVRNRQSPRPTCRRSASSLF